MTIVSHETLLFYLLTIISAQVTLPVLAFLWNSICTYTESPLPPKHLPYLDFSVNGFFSIHVNLMFVISSIHVNFMFVISSLSLLTSCLLFLLFLKLFQSHLLSEYLTSFTEVISLSQVGIFVYMMNEQNSFCNSLLRDQIVRPSLTPYTSLYPFWFASLTLILTHQTNLICSSSLNLYIIVTEYIGSSSNYLHRQHTSSPNTQ